MLNALHVLNVSMLLFSARLLTPVGGFAAPGAPGRYFGLSPRDRSHSIRRQCGPRLGTEKNSARQCCRPAALANVQALSWPAEKLTGDRTTTVPGQDQLVECNIRRDNDPEATYLFGKLPEPLKEALSYTRILGRGAFGIVVLAHRKSSGNEIISASAYGGEI